MNFANRYELSESITTGRVETFPARDITSDERVLIFVFESAAPQPGNVPTIQWVLEAFNKIAPAPKEIVINAGRYSGTAFLYLVTKMPASDALNRWIEVYQGYGSETQEFRVIPKPENKEPQAPQPTVEPKTVGTNAFPALGLDLQSADGGPERSRPTEAFELQGEDASLRRQSGTFTSLFLAGFDKSSEASKAPETSHQMNPDWAGSTRDPLTTAPDSVARVPGERATGEFTKFFKGPFSGEASPDTPKNLLPTAVPEAAPGEFTRLFGRRVEEASREAPSEPTPRMQTENLSLTQRLSEPPRGRIDQQTPPPIVTPPMAYGPASMTRDQTDVPGRPVASPTVVPSPSPAWQPDPAPPLSTLEVPPATSAPAAAAYNQENATQLFSYSGRAAEPTLPAGPSEYTMIIARPSMPLGDSSVEPAIEGAGTRKPVPLPPAAMPRVPPTPKMPAIAPFPPMPAMPPPPKLPQTPPEAKPVSYWPLILVMTVMFFLAVLLVMYFVLKH